MASDEEIDNFLSHHGVKGMHWGIRKAIEDLFSRSKKEEVAGAKGSTSLSKKSNKPKSSKKEQIQTKREIAAKEFEAKAANYQ